MRAMNYAHFQISIPGRLVADAKRIVSDRKLHLDVADLICDGSRRLLDLLDGKAPSEKWFVVQKYLPRFHEKVLRITVRMPPGLLDAVDAVEGIDRDAVIIASLALALRAYDADAGRFSTHQIIY